MKAIQELAALIIVAGFVAEVMHVMWSLLQGAI